MFMKLVQYKYKIKVVLVL